MPINPLNHHYSFENPASIYDEEAMTALELAGRTAAKVNEIVGDQNELRTETEERLHAQDVSIEYMQTHTIPETVTAEVQEHINDGSFASEINEYAGNLTARLDNLTGSLSEGSTTLDAEVIDLRTDSNSIIYASAGAAARKHQRHTLDSFDRAMYGSYLLFFNWVQGGIDTSTGAVTSQTNRIRTSNNKPSGTFDRLVFSCPSGYQIGIVYYYSADNSYKIEWATPNVETVIDKTATSYRLIAKKTDDGAITPAEGNYFYPRTDIAALNDKFLDNLKKASCATHYACNDGDITPDQVVSGGSSWFVNGFSEANNVNTVIPAGAFIRRLTIPTVPLNGHECTVGVWYLDGTTLTLATNKTVSNVNGTFTIDLNWHAEKPALVSVYSVDRIFYYAQEPGRYMWASYTPDQTTLDTTKAIQFNIFKNMCLGATLTYETVNVGNSNPSIITVGPGGDFDEIRDAVESITDTVGVYTILVYPRATPYKSFSMIRKMSTGEIYPWDGAPVRKISIIGMDARHCVVVGDTGEYYNPACEALCIGTIKNMTFRNTNKNITTESTGGGYAVHIDCPGLNGAAYNITFEGCTFTSESGPGAGIGLHQSGVLTFRNCHFHNVGNPSYVPHAGYTNIVNYGSIFAHASTKANVTGQQLVLDNCRIMASKANKALWLSTPGEYDPTNCEFIVSAYNNICYAGGSGAVKVDMADDLTLDPSSWGNNADVLNGG